MENLSVQAAVGMLNQYRIKCTEHTIRRWLRQGKINGIRPQNRKERWLIPEGEIWDLIDAPRWEGTAYETGIDDQTKLERLFEEVMDLRQQIKELSDENFELRFKLGLDDF